MSTTKIFINLNDEQIIETIAKEVIKENHLTLKTLTLKTLLLLINKTAEKYFAYREDAEFMFEKFDIQDFSENFEDNKYFAIQTLDFEIESKIMNMLQK